MVTVLRLVLALGTIGVAAGHGAAQTDQGEYRLKAVFLYQFPQFVEWPEPAWRDAKSVQLCVARPNPFGEELDRLVRGDSLRGRPLAVRTVASPVNSRVAICSSSGQRRSMRARCSRLRRSGRS